MKQSQSVVAVACVAALLVGVLFESAAWAAPIIDKGDLGKYERKGRLVFRVLTPPPRNTDMSPAPQYRPDGKFVLNRGPAGAWERHGRILKRQLEGHASETAMATVYPGDNDRVVNHIKHRHRFSN